MQISKDVQTTIDFKHALESIGVSSTEAAWMCIAHRRYQYQYPQDTGKFKYEEDEHQPEEPLSVLE